ncbi:hypothetical protein J1N35_017181 [Gossypium stocksii]|uniref:RNase H type-1 domain-containing protein n=1 Tax=Gossypium stocksii TaxID=47602 RepID=A0A9D3VLW3_9ROSI|nr:hypothetical protein J1N35_017181 [Gossypium stocksii]
MASSNSIQLLSENWIQLNINGAVKEDSEFATIGWVLRDRIKGIWNGLMIAPDRGSDRLLIFSDSQEAGLNFTLERKIRLVLAIMVYWSIHHVSKDFNKDANTLVEMTVGYNDGLQFFETPPRGLGCISK